MNNNCDIKKIYKKILNDKEILKIYKDIEIKDEARAFHNFEHIKNVTLIVEEILTDLEYDLDYIYKAKIACFLHDTGVIYGKEEHAIRSYEYAKKYFKENKINFNDIDLVLEAIKVHSDGFDTDNIIALVLILADKLDIKKSRITNFGKTFIGNRQYSHIEDIIMKIKNNKLEVNFITDKNIDLEELCEYYFTKKVFKSIIAFSNKLNLKYEVKFNNNIYKI